MNIKAYREKHELSQEDLARMLGVTAMTVHRWENGKSKPHRIFRKELERLEKKSKV